MNVVNECKSYGSVSLKQIAPKVFECEHCKRKIEDFKVCSSVCSLLAIASLDNNEVDHIRAIIIDPARTITFLPPPDYSKF